VPVLIRNFEIRLASQRDAVHIAGMSRQLIEVGLGWSWTPRRVIRSLQDRDTNVAVAHDGGRIIGVGTALINWIEATVLTAGIGVIYLEARLSNVGARAFYRKLGYQEVKTVPGMYNGIEPGVRLAKDLWS
jgi:ribosomal-protein-alanine N-acetyltransferase